MRSRLCQGRCSFILDVSGRQMLTSFSTRNACSDQASKRGNLAWRQTPEGLAKYDLTLCRVAQNVKLFEVSQRKFICQLLDSVTVFLQQHRFRKRLTLVDHQPIQNEQSSKLCFLLPASPSKDDASFLFLWMANAVPLHRDCSANVGYSWK